MYNPWDDWPRAFDYAMGYHHGASGKRAYHRANKHYMQGWANGYAHRRDRSV